MINSVTKKYKVDGMHCVSCAMLIEGELEGSKIVDEATCNYITLELTVKSQKEINNADVSRIVEKLGYKITPVKNA